jgi:hypothetical protein
MVEAERVDVFDVATISPAVLDVLRHLCQGGCHSFGGVLRWCEARGDCAQAVICPVCNARFLVDDDELDELLRWTDEKGQVLVCGVRWD